MLRLSPALLLLALAACDTARDDGRIVRYEGPAITEADATVPNPPFGPAGWDGLVFIGRAGISVSVDRTTTCGDECAQTILFSFNDAPPADPSPGALPETVTGIVETVQGNPDGSTSAAFAIGRVEIDQWGPDVYSGVVHGASGNPDIVPARIVFWADDLPTAVE